MNEQESVAECLTGLVLVTNQIKVCVETMSELTKFEKVLRILTTNFDYIVCEIEESNDLVAMEIEDL